MMRGYEEGIGAAGVNMGEILHQFNGRELPQSPADIAGCGYVAPHYSEKSQYAG